MDFITIEANLSQNQLIRWKELVDFCAQTGSMMIAFSGGIDSSLLCAAGWRALGNKMMAVTIHSPVESAGDIESARNLASQIGFPLKVLEYDDLLNPDFVSNHPDRCYICKKGRFQILQSLAKKEGFNTLAEGSNIDDLSDYRPGLRAVKETNTLSPLQELRFTKKEIRELSKGLGLNNWDRPSAPCLATRFPYGTPITQKGLEQIKGEEYLHNLGFQSIRVRDYDEMTRIEVNEQQIEKLVSMRQSISIFFRSIGYKYISIDLDGYRQGSMNEVL